MNWNMRLELIYVEFTIIILFQPFVALHACPSSLSFLFQKFDAGFLQLVLLPSLVSKCLRQRILLFVPPLLVQSAFCFFSLAFFATRGVVEILLGLLACLLRTSLPVQPSDGEHRRKRQDQNYFGVYGNSMHRAIISGYGAR